MSTNLVSGTSVAARPSNLEGFGQLTFHTALLLITAATVMGVTGGDEQLHPPIFLVPAMFLHGVVLVALFAPNHECVHRTVFATPWLNDGLAWVLGWLLFIPSVDFRYFHFAHHRHTQDPALDPELKTPKPATRGQYLFALTGVPFWIASARWFWTLTVRGAKSDYLHANKRAAAQRQAIVYLILYAVAALLSVAFGSALALVLWIGPMLLAQPVLRAYLMAEHTGCDLGPDMFRNTRTVLSNPVVRALMWNMPYHAEHHAKPATPFYALPALHAQSQGKHAHLEPGYGATHNTITRSHVGQDRR